MKLYELNRAVFSIKNDPEKLLNGLTSNVLDAPRNAFLNIHGRIVATFDQIRIDKSEFWVIVEASFAEALLEHLDRYVRLSKAEVCRLDKHVYFDLDSENTLTLNEGVVIPQKAGRLLICDDQTACDVLDADFTLFRLKNNIPFHSVDYKDEFVLNISGEEIVSFTKGCFLGQEPVSKVHNRSSPTWKLVVKYENECSTKEKGKMISKVVDPHSGRVQGFTFVHNNS